MPAAPPRSRVTTVIYYEKNVKGNFRRQEGHGDQEKRPVARIEVKIVLESKFNRTNRKMPV